VKKEGGTPSHGSLGDVHDFGGKAENTHTLGHLQEKPEERACGGSGGKDIQKKSLWREPIPIIEKEQAKWSTSQPKKGNTLSEGNPPGVLLTRGKKLRRARKSFHEEHKAMGRRLGFRRGHTKGAPRSAPVKRKK